MESDHGDEPRSSTRLAAPPEDSAFTPADLADGAGPETSVPPLRGRLLDDRYLVERPIGRGGMATVFLARDVRLGRDVAVKVLAPELGAPSSHRFHREIRIAATLRHPNLVPVFDSGEVDGMLYFVMPHVVGESLRARLRAQRQLGVAETLAIARDVAAALDFAHARGIVHRDVKPENVLLEGGRALVADFGVARALGTASVGGAGVTALTDEGIVLGTPAYMSPEQATSDDAVDARSDVYALGCVVYEMLAGEPPFSGGGARAVVAKHLHAAPVPLRVLRPPVAALDAAVEVALAKAPADRYASAGAFVRALESGAASGAARSRRRTLLLRVGAVLAAVGAVAAWGALDRGLGAPSALRAAPSLDASAVAVFPFETADAPDDAASVTMLVQDGFRRWRGVAVRDPAEGDSTLAGPRARRLTPRAARSVTASLGAARYVRGTVTRAGDSLRLRATLHDARVDSALGDVTVRVAGGERGAAAREAAVADLVARLLFPGVDSATRALVGRRTSVPRAYAAFAEGMAAVRGWDLARADSAFSVAVESDDELAVASLWLAQVRSWQRAVPARWRVAAERAARGTARLDAREAAFAHALLALSEGRHERACPAWERLAGARRDDFAAWYGLATCLRGDSVVVRDARSPTGWRFRRSYHGMLQAYQTAFRLMPSMHRALAERSFASVRRLFVTSRNIVGVGYASAPDTLSFVARPSWAGDSLVFIPVPKQSTTGARPRLVLGATDEAVRRQREIFRQVAVAWLAADPRSAPAMEALALALEMLGEPAALDSLHRARSLARVDGERRRLAADEVWLRVKFAVPDDSASLRRAVDLADSLLATEVPTPADAELLSGLASLTGRAVRAAALTRAAHAAEPERRVGGVVQPGWALLAFASLGGPVDSLAWLERRVADAVVGSVPAARLRAERLQWLAWPATLAFPSVSLASVATLAGTGDPLLDAQAAALRGDTASARARLAELRAGRATMRPEDVTLDALYPEAALLARIGREREAAEWLEPTLRALDASQVHSFADVVRAGSLVRALALSADLADRAGSRATARRWASAVTVLWRNADPFLEPVVARMRRLGR